MRIKSNTHINLWLLAILVWCSPIAAQTALIGDLRNGAPVLKDAKLATQVLLTGLPDAASVTDLSIVKAVEGDQVKYFLIAQISGAAFSAKGIELEQEGNQLYAAAGPGVEVSCEGVNCRSCVIRFKGIRPWCDCVESGPGLEAARCDMHIKMVIQPW